LVREVDAMGGLIGKISDLSGIQFKVLNSSKGAAVHGPRAQMDRDIYAKNMQQAILEGTPSLSVLCGSAFDLIIEGGECKGIVLESGEKVTAKAVVLTTGTFLNAKCYIGDRVINAGRFMRKEDGAEPAQEGLARSLRNHNFPIERLRTGTPPRIDGATIDYTGMSV